MRINYENIATLTRKLILLALVLLLFIPDGMAQEQKITLSRQNMPRREAVEQIKTQTGYNFAINHRAFDAGESVYFNSLTLPLREVLNQLLAGTPLTYTIQNSLILIFAVEDEKAEPKKEEKQAEEVKEEPVKEKEEVQPPRSSYTPPSRNAYQSNSRFDYQFEQDVNQGTSRTRPFSTQPQRSTVTPSTSKSSATSPTSHVVTPKKETPGPTAVAPAKTSKPSTTAIVAVSGSTGGKSSGITKVDENYRDMTKNFPLIRTDNPLPDYSSYLTQPPGRFSVKINALYGLVALTPNIAVEIGLSRKISLDLAVGVNPFKQKGTEESNKKLNHLLIKPEIRYWLCERSNGHFFGVHPLYINYNISDRKVPLLFDKKYRYEGNGYGIGVSYGYHWMLNKHWGIELNAGVGAIFLDYDKFECKKCSNKMGTYKKNYFGPTSAGIKLVYVFK